MRRAAKIDANQTEIVKAARKMGFRVKSLAAVGQGFPDLCVQIGHKTELWEIKRQTKTPEHARRLLTIDQERILSDGWHVHLIQTSDDVLARFKAISGK